MVLLSLAVWYLFATVFTIYLYAVFQLQVQQAHFKNWNVKENFKCFAEIACAISFLPFALQFMIKCRKILESYSSLLRV